MGQDRRPAAVQDLRRGPGSGFRTMHGLCGGKLDNQFSWSPETRTFATPAGRILFTPMHARIFDVIWKSGKAGIQDRERFTQAVYGDQADGGVDGLNTLSVHLIRMRNRMASTGYTITTNMGNPRQGWRLVKLPVHQQHEAAE
jgi:hypothetical protein